jgi:predicted ATPase/class 3 adenylate cyclase
MRAPVRTFLFTDIEGSYRQWERHPEAMPRALAEHDAILRQAVAGNRGRIFKTVGDAVCAVFERPLDGMRAAVDAQRALHATPWVAIGLAQPLTVRMALHAGEAEERDGDFTGLVLNRISRLLRAGHGGQVLVAPSVADELLPGALPGVGLRDFGERRLRDVPGANRVYQLEIDGLPVSFPPLETLDSIAHNLPVTLNACLDRETELARIRQLLLDSPARLVTLLGPGGIGKTRLALHAATGLVDAFSGGIWFVDLSGVRDAGLVPAAVASVLGGRIEPGSDPVTAIAAQASDRTLLLILDNCEHLVDGVARLVAALLPRTGGVQVLATSRVPLQIQGEQRVEVGPLPVEANELAGPAVQLFLERAQQIRPAFELTDANRDSIFEICHRVDGIPLALELAAARVAVLSPDALRTRLSSRLSLLTSSSRDLPERHQTLRAAIAWSYALLTEEEQRVFRALSVFQGGWSFAAAQAVLALDELQTMDVLASLRDKSLVRLAETDDGEARYSMLETIQEFGFEQLAVHDELSGVQGAFLSCFLEIVSQAAGFIEGGPQQQLWLKRIDQELANLRSALQWAIERTDGGTAVDLAIGLWYYWSIRGLTSEGQRWLGIALTLTEEIDLALRSRAIRMLGNLCVERGELPAAEALYRASLDSAEVAGHQLGMAQSLSFLGMVAGMQGRPEEEYAYQVDALERCRALGSERGIGGSLVNLAVWALNQGKTEEALVLLDEVQAVNESRRDEIGLAFTFGYRAQVLGARGELEDAAALFEIAEQMGTQSDSPDTVAFARLGHALVELRRNNTALAELLAEEALAAYRDRGDKRVIAECLETLSLVYTRNEEFTRAAVELGAANYLRELSNSTASPLLSTLVADVASKLQSTLGRNQFSLHWERGRQRERRANWLVVAPPGLLELVESLSPHVASERLL